MIPTTVVNLRFLKPCDVYIGRSTVNAMHFGNPWSHLPLTLAEHRTETREEAVNAYKAWLHGTDHHDIEPERRAWILKQIPSLVGKILGCFCKPEMCHGEVLATLANELQND